MTLKELIEELGKHNPGKVVPHGFDHPHSDRGNYSNLAFEPTENVTVGQMLKAAKSALGTTYIGWKGGEFTMEEHTDCYIGEEGYCGEGIGPTLLKYMLGETETKKDDMPDDPMTTPNGAEKAAKAIRLYVADTMVYGKKIWRDDDITAIIEEETRVEEKEGALRDCIKWIKIVAGDKPNKTTRKLIWEAQRALAKMPEKDLLEPYKNVVNEGGSYKPGTLE